MHVTLDDRFVLLDKIASGGMGKVYLARDRRDPYQPLVAVKVLHPHLAEEREFVSLFIDEARVTTRLRHPHVVRVFEAERVGEHLVLVMEYVEGAALRDIQRLVLAREEQLPLGFVVRVVLDALSGLHFAHELADEQTKKPLEIIHRDVSPHNILVGTDGRARIGDFGVARWTQRLAHTRSSLPVRGKMRYLAPEQLEKKQQMDRRVDVFTTGIVLWECLAGRDLFAGDTDAEVVAAMMWEPITPPSVHRPELSQAIDDVCLRALERDPARRYRSAGELAAALQEAAKDDVFTREQVGAFVSALVEPTLAQRRAVAKREEAKREEAPAEEEPAAGGEEPAAVEAPARPASTTSSVEDVGDASVMFRVRRRHAIGAAVAALAALVVLVAVGALGALGRASGVAAQAPEPAPSGTATATTTATTIAMATAAPESDAGAAVEDELPVTAPRDAHHARAQHRTETKPPPAHSTKGMFMPNHL